jgi:hypothetical protein
MKFQFPDTLPAKSSTLSKNTIVTYKTQLNRIAKNHHIKFNKTTKEITDTIFYDTAEKLMKYGKQVVEVLKEVWPDDKTRRLALFSIFWILSDEDYIKTSNPYYEYYQTVLPATKTDGSAWLKRADYTVDTSPPESAS